MRPRSIRFRITAVATVLVAAVLAISGVVLVMLQRSALIRSTDQALSQRADNIVALLKQGDPPAQFVAGSEERLVQLVDADGLVVAATPNLEREPALNVAFAPIGDTVRDIADIQVEDDDDDFRVLSRPLDGGVLHVGTTVEVVTDSTGALTGSLALTIPAVVVILGLLVWWLVGRTLQLVEDIRSEVATIRSTDLDRRVPRPGTEDEIDRLAMTMNEMLERLESSVDRQQRFVADASHELRSPLTRLRAELELDVSASENEGETERLGSLLSEVVGMQDMVEDLLYLAQTDARDTPPVAAPLDLDDLVLREGRRIATNGRVQVSLSNVSGAHVLGDRSQLGRAVKNLLDNAERHAAGRVTVGLRELDSDAVLSVSDDGPGIPAAGAEQIFERFGRLDEARGSETGGTGLGLAIAAEIVERHGGTLVLANPGQPGAVFELSLPLPD